VRVLALVLLAGVLTLGCISGPRGFEPVRFEPVESLPFTERSPNWPVPPEQAMELLRSRHYDIRAVKRTKSGTGGAMKVRMHFGSLNRDLDFKVKLVPQSLGGINNSPRREMAAYSVQTLFLDPPDYLVPATAVHCSALERWREVHGNDEPQLPGSNCVMIAASLWLTDVTLPDAVYDKQRFLKDPVYAGYLADFNLLTYLVDHRDGRRGNVLISKEDDRRQVFAIDNGVSFGPMWPFYNWFVPNWNVLRVAALRKSSVDRLRPLERKDLDFLLAVQELRDNGSGHYVNVERGPLLDDNGGVQARDGIVQFGLTRREVDDIWHRVRTLIERVDEGHIPVF